MNKNLTQREKEVFDFICKFWEEKNFSPTLKDIAENMYFSITVAHKHVWRLFDKGYIGIIPYTHRSITILK